ncbi:TetR/AcrR family transcriptional regulator [Hoyosella altamirensis]|uniref:AcrR family transcriptional regulator n=1 Tax=Hoyosella altamirensis TaxID=616997 RepID=A0A839RJH3_9ACTN|nr:TetR family transcriptional regulator C-terminal domain-containing protein [Hoyosella altamirensis]MBB3036557.1 AcrR family transcriptional regulator [Hoyosella altamirensis]
MPRHEEASTRRQQITEALLDAVATRGIQKTSLADVAEFAGVSVGLVQRYFRTKDELLRFGVAHVFERTEQRVHQTELVLPIRTYLERLLRCVLPLDAERQKELRFWLNFLHVGLTDPAMAALHHDATHNLIDGLARALAGAQRRGELSADVSTDVEAAALVAFVDGLCLHHATNPDAFPAHALVRALDSYLSRLFNRADQSPEHENHDCDTGELAHQEEI